MAKKQRLEGSPAAAGWHTPSGDTQTNTNRRDDYHRCFGATWPAIPCKPIMQDPPSRSIDLMAGLFQAIFPRDFNLCLLSSSQSRLTFPVTNKCPHVYSCSCREQVMTLVLNLSAATMTRNDNRKNPSSSAF